MIGLLYCDGINNVVQYAEDCNANALHPSMNNMRYPMLAEQCREQGIKLHVWTVNTEADMRQMVELGADAEKAVEYRETTEHREPKAHKNVLLHCMGIGYSKIRKLFVRLDGFVQRLASK